MVEGDWNGVFLLGEKCEKLDVGFDALVILDGHDEVGEGIDAVFLLAPIEARGPFFFGFDEPLALHAKVAACIGVFEGRCCDG